MDEIKFDEMGRRLAEIRKANRYTQDQLAAVLELTPKHISHCESGTSCLSFKKLVEFCNLCNCSLDYIVWGKSKDDKIERLDNTVLSILRTGTDEEVNHVNRYLEIYSEMLLQQKNM